MDQMMGIMIIIVLIGLIADTILSSPREPFLWVEVACSSLCARMERIDTSKAFKSALASKQKTTVIDAPR